MTREEKINIITNHLVLQKQKSELELERFLNSDTSIDLLCTGIEDRISTYRNNIININMWLEFVQPQDNPTGDK
jgi:hypothetical protein